MGGVLAIVTTSRTQYSAPIVGGEAQADGCGWQSRAPDHWRAQECPSQTPAERLRDRIKRPRRAMGCGSEYLRFAAAASGAVGEAVSTVGMAGGILSGNGIFIRCCCCGAREAVSTVGMAGGTVSGNGFFIHCCCCWAAFRWTV